MSETPQRRAGIRSVGPDVGIRSLGQDAGMRSPRSDGNSFSLNQSPSQRAVHAELIRAIKLDIVQDYQPGYVSSNVARAGEMSMGGFERQTDQVSCGYHTLANAMRLLDGQRSEYSMRAIKEALAAKSGRPAPAQLNLHQPVLELGFPYGRFAVDYTRPDEGVSSMKHFFAQLANGEVGLWDANFSPDYTVRRGFDFSHRRLIAGFSVDDKSEITVHVVDPYHAEERRWTFEDFMLATRFDAIDQGNFVSAQDFEGNTVYISILKKIAPIISVSQESGIRSTRPRIKEV